MIFERLLEDFKRANKVAREKLATKFGFSSAGDYEKYLIGQIAGKLATEEKKKSTKKAKVEARKEEVPTDMVIAFDTTGSMSSYIAAVRKHVSETIDNLFNNTPNLRLKIVAFGDYCDMVRPKKSNGPSTAFGNAYQETPLTDNKEELMNFVRNASNTGGGDGPEFYELVLKKILDETPWRVNSNRTILLIGDSDPHEIGYTLPPFVYSAQIDWREQARKAVAMGIKIDTLRIHNHVDWYIELSTTTNGTCIDFKSAGKTQKIVEASTYFASKSKKSVEAAGVLYRSALVAGDDELVGAYKAMAYDRGIDLDKL